MQIRTNFPNRVTINRCSLNKDVQREIKKPTMTTVTFPPEPAANPDVVPSQHQGIPFGMQTSVMLLRYKIYLQELTTGFLFGPWPCVPAKKSPPAAPLSLRHNAVYAAPIEADFCWQSLFTAISTNNFRLLPARLLPPTCPPRLVLLLSLPQLSSILRNPVRLVGKGCPGCPLAQGHRTQCPHLAHPPLPTLQLSMHFTPKTLPVAKSPQGRRKHALSCARHKRTCGLWLEEDETMRISL